MRWDGSIGRYGIDKGWMGQNEIDWLNVSSKMS